VHGFGHSAIGVGVGDVERRSIANGLGVFPLGVKRPWEACPQGSVASVIDARERGELDLIARDSDQPARVRSQQADGAGEDRVEDRLIGERLMTPRISPVAVCCSRASVSERLSPSFSSLRSA
jgi:hypothetical protein